MQQNQARRWTGRAIEPPVGLFNKPTSGGEITAAAAAGGFACWPTYIRHAALF